MNEQVKPKSQNQQKQSARTVTMTEMYTNSGKVIRNVLRTQKPVQISEYGTPVVEISPIREEE